MEDTVLGSEVPVTKVVHHAGGDDYTIKVTNGVLLPYEDGKKEEEENALDAEFIKVEKELLDVKEGSCEDVPQIVLSRSTSSDRELLESKEKARELENEIERLVSSLKHSESESARLKDDISVSKQKLEVSDKKCEELEFNLNALKEALVGQESKHKELMEVQESFEALVSELTRELELRKASDSQIKEDMSAIECLFASSKEDLRSKISELEDTKAKMETQEVQITVMKAELGVTIKDKEELEKSVENLTKTANQLKELCGDLDEKLKVSDENFCKSDSLLAQTQSNNSELKQKLKALEELHSQSGGAAKTATQKNLELDQIIGDSETAVEERKLKELYAKISDLNATLKGVEEEKQQLISQNEEDKKKIVELESAINDSSLRRSELENDLKSSLDRFTEHEDTANMTHQRSLELEDLIQISQTKVGEMELLLEAEKNKIQELEEQKSSLEKKCKDVEAESKKYYDKMSETLFDLEAFQARASSLENALAAAYEKERESTESLNIVSEEKKHLESALDTPRKKLAESENLLEMLRNELNLAQGKIGSMENDLEASRIRESEVIEKFKSTEEQLEQSTARNLELQLLHESSTRESEIKLREVMTNFTGRDFDAKSLSGKLIDLEEKVKIYEEQVSEFGAKSATLKDELEQTSTKSAYLESANEELKKQILEVESKASQYTSENELLVDTNIQLKSKVGELEKLLSSALSEKEMASQPILSHKGSSDEMMESNSRSIEADIPLREALQRYNQRDEEAKDLNEKLKTLECQLTIFEEHAQEASSNAEFHRAQMEETLVKFKHLESVVVELENKGSQLEMENVGLAEANMRLAQEMAVYESKSIEDQEKLSAAQNGRGDAVDRFHSSERSIEDEDLTQKLTSEEQRLQSQISSVMEDNNLLNITHQNTKRELQSTLEQLEEQLKQQKENEKSLFSEITTLRAEIEEKTGLETLIKDLEEKLKTFEAQLKAEKEADSRKEIDQEVGVEGSQAKQDAKKKETELLEKQIKELEQKLHHAESKSPEKVNGVEVKSREIGIGSTLASPTKRKQKKKAEATSLPPETVNHTAEVSSIGTLKFILAVALVSVIIGIILGKRY